VKIGRAEEMRRLARRNRRLPATYAGSLSVVMVVVMHALSFNRARRILGAIDSCGEP
jgi:hypothetical protein